MSTETWKQGGSTVRTLDFTYDTVDRLTALDDSDVLATDFEFAYDQRGQLVAERQLSGLIGTSVVFTRQYDDRGNRSELAANFGGTLSGGSVSGGIGDFVNEYVYDERDRLGSVTQTEQSGGHAVAPKHATLIYNRASQLTDLRRYSADWASWSDLEVHSRREYDGAGRLVSITHGNQEISGSQTWDGTSTPPSSLGASGMLAAYRMDYDENHRLASLGSYADGFETSYGYDDRDQLTSAASAVISGLSQPYGIPSSESYDFDENGNRKSSGGQSQSDPDTHNQLQSDGTFNYTYDDEGNTLTRTEIASGEVTEYEWDHRNRLVSITEKASSTGSVTQKIEYIYDAFDHRVGKRLDSDGNGTWDRDEAFVWTDGQTHLRLTDADGEGTTETFHVTSRYLYGDIVDHLLGDEQYTDGAGPAVDATTASTTAGETLWALVDHLGSVRDLVANGGVVREHVVYDSFGNRLVEQDYDSSGNAISSSHAAAVDSLFGYTGRDWDKDAGLQYNRARWYDPATGRWLSQDPIGFEAGDANLYRYVGNAATTKTDPSGLEEEGEWTSMGGYNPWAWNLPLGQKTVIGWLSGGWSATSRANELARQERTYRRQQAINDPCSQYAIDMQQTYRATPSELRRMREFAETGIQFNAMVLGGGALRPSAVGLVDDLPLKLPADTPGGGLQKIPYMLDSGKLRRSLSGGKVGSFKGQRIDFVISSDGKLVIGQGHSVLSDGCPVKFAGQLKFNRKGRLVEITNDSGHFKPPAGQGLTQKAKDYLEQLGIDVSGAEVVEVGG